MPIDALVTLWWTFQEPGYALEDLLEGLATPWKTFREPRNDVQEGLRAPWEISREPGKASEGLRGNHGRRLPRTLGMPWKTLGEPWEALPERPPWESFPGSPARGRHAKNLRAPLGIP